MRVCQRILHHRLQDCPGKSEIYPHQCRHNTAGQTDIIDNLPMRAIACPEQKTGYLRQRNIHRAFAHADEQP